MVENNKRLDELIRDDEHIKTWEICVRLGIGFNTMKIILDNLQYKKMCTRWVSWKLTPDHKEQRQQACADILQQYQTMDDGFLESDITREGI